MRKRYVPIWASVRATRLDEHGVPNGPTTIGRVIWGWRRDIRDVVLAQRRRRHR